MHKGHTACDYSKGDEQPVFLLHRGPVQELQAWEQQRPAEQRCPLRQKHVRNCVDPPQTLIGKVCRGLVESGQEFIPAAYPLRGEDLLVVEQIRKAKTAAYQEHIGRQHGYGILLEPLLKEIVHAQHHYEICVQRRQHSGKPKRRAKRIERGADAVAEERIAQRSTGQQRIIRRKILLHADARDEPKVHTQIAVGTLSDMERAVRCRHYCMVNMQYPADGDQRDHRP